MAEIFCIVNQKGGVGKTTTSINLATALAAIDKKVLLIDFDPQGNATTSFGYKGIKKTIYDVLVNDGDINEIVVNTEIENLDILPSDINLAGAEIELLQTKDKHFCLKKKLSEMDCNYDFIIIDCPPSLGMITLNALTASSSAIVVVQCEFFALEGVSHIINTINSVKQNLNKSLKIDGFLLTMYDLRNKLTHEVENELRLNMKNVYETVIPRNVVASYAQSNCKPVLIYDLKSPISQAYIKFARELIEKNNIKI